MPHALNTQHSIDFATRAGFEELVAMEQLSRLSAGGLVRVLQTIPRELLEAALVSAVFRSPCRDGGATHDGRSPPPGSR